MNEIVGDDERVAFNVFERVTLTDKDTEIVDVEKRLIV